MNSREITKNQFDRTVEMLNKMTGESMHIRFYSGAFWAFGSELATLKLPYKLETSKGAIKLYKKRFVASLAIVIARLFQNFGVL